MLTNQGGNKQNIKNDIFTESTNRILGFLVAGGVFSMLFYTFARAKYVDIQTALFETNEPVATTKTIGIQLMTNFVLPFEASGILLMATLIGAAYLSKKNSE